jgi:mannose/fructose/N-acetylgalactosamine-specific phosphotransferase system component IIC
VDVTLLLTASLVCGAAAAVLQLDRKELGQVVLSPPVVAAPLLGLLLGHADVGCWVGATFGLLWVSDLGRGVRYPANDTLAAVVCVGGAVAAGGSAEVTGLALLLAAPLAVLGRLVDAARERRNVELSRRAAEAARGGDPDWVGRAVRLGLLRAAWPAALLGAGGVAAVAGLSDAILPLLPVRLLTGLALLPLILPAVAAGAALAVLPGRWPVGAFGIVALALGSGLALLGGGG